MMKSPTRLIATLLVQLLTISTIAAAATIHVPANQPTIQAGINAANNGDTVQVANGTYTGTGNHSIRFRGKAITLKGNSDDPSKVVIDCQGSYDNSHRAVVFKNNETQDSVLDGFTITNVFFMDDAAIYIAYPACPTIVNCVIVNNTSNGIGYGYYGEFEEKPFMRIENCKMIDNFNSGITGVHGEIINCVMSGNRWQGVSGCSGLIKGCVISNNQFRGIEEFDGLIDKCEILGNKVSAGVAGIRNKYRRADITNCLIAGNKAYGGGGAISAFNGGNIINCTFVSNIEGDSVAGINHRGDGDIKNCIFWDDRAEGGSNIYLDSLEYVSFESNNIKGGIEKVSYDPESQIFIKNNIDADPLFADPGYWHDNETSNDTEDDYFVYGDYHLKSQAGRWDQLEEVWVEDDVTSPCVDAGSLTTDYINEPFPHGRRANMGVYGNTEFASKSLSDVSGSRTITVSLDGTGDYDRIQRAIKAAAFRDDVVLVDDGIYTGPGNRNIDFLGKLITVKSKNGPEKTIIDCQGPDGESYYGFSFNSGETHQARLDGFTIANANGQWQYESGSGVIIYWSSPSISNCIVRRSRSPLSVRESNSIISNCTFAENLTLQVIIIGNSDCLMENCLIVGNRSAYRGLVTVLDYGSDSEHSHLQLRNCTLSDNAAQSFFHSDSYDNLLLSLDNCAFWGNDWQWSFLSFFDGTVSVANSNIPGGKNTLSGAGDNLLWGYGNIDCNPLFVSQGYWDDKDTPDDYLDDVWYPGDYHLKSAGWRWDAANSRWTYDNVTSPCIDKGNPGMSLGDEPITLEIDPANTYAVNKRINMGAYGGTAEASMAPTDTTLLADINNDRIVNADDLEVVMENWLSTQPNNHADFNRDTIINFDDFALFAGEWQEWVEIDLQTINHWPFDDDGTDIIGGNYGTIENGAYITKEQGNFIIGSGSVRLDGIDDLVRVAGYKGITGPASRTVMAWIKSPDLSSNMAIVSWGGELDGQKFIFKVASDGTVVLKIGGDGGGIGTADSIDDGQWHHIALVIPAAASPTIADVKIYIDGYEQAYAIQGNALINTGNQFDVNIGSYNGGIFFNGLIDDVRIYNYQLTASEIADLQGEALLFCRTLACGAIAKDA